jgi:hypothetical protein
MSTTTDERLGPERLIRIRSARPDGSVRVLPVLQGGLGAMGNRVAREVAAAAEGFATRALDVANSLAGPRERAAMIRTHSASLFGTLQKAAAEARTEREELAARMRSISATKPYSSGVGHLAAEDLALAQAFRALPAGERAKQLRMMQEEGWSDPRLADALQRTHSLLHGCDWHQTNALRVAGVRDLMRDEFATLEARRHQLHAAEVAIRTAVEVVREAVGTASDIMEHAPAALAVTATPLEWEPQPPAAA